MVKARVKIGGFMKNIFLSLLVAGLLSGCMGVRTIPDAVQKNEGGVPVEKTFIIIETTQGEIEILLMPLVAPKTCENFIALAEKGYYNGTIFHRVIKGFMIQGGDPTGTGCGGSSIWGKPFDDEVSDNVTFDRSGLLAMANAGKNTNGSQFFITTANTPWLNMKHTIFGEVVNGKDVITKIENVSVGRNDKPLTDQKIIKIQIKKK
ncbi:peptidyl-prolyl cis-trans isomerase [Candidatus Omnitrophus magneticus]|uniref:Peptidyl-prolyl cis-trans isomerase n=1 Tax=Candidatus Omnitrophus magneticus TaxID=1609969 RepID=A0A0F0CNK9_9BACT|nr:peptidyl-prolyl cis-trans isomerase [Candidatus Omnitrophus magneticus]